MTESDDEKRLAGIAAADEVQPGMVLGLGSGTTVYFFLEELGRRVRSGLRVAGIPTSEQTAALARQLGIPLTTFEEHQTLDLAVDGADEVDPHLDLIKGRGGALLREKIIARSSRRRIIIVDDRKLSPELGTRSPLPVEVAPFAYRVAERGLQGLGAEPVLRTAESGQPYVTDNGNWILDCHFPPITDPERLEAEVNALPGVMDNGLFVGLADKVIVARGSAIEQLVRMRQTEA